MEVRASEAKFSVVGRGEVCPVCGKGRVVYLLTSKGRREVPVACDCEVSMAEGERIRLENMAKEAKRRAKMRRSFGDRVPGGSFARDDGKGGQAMEACRNYAERFREIMGGSPNGLVLHGPARQGKTFAAEAVAMHLFDQGHKVYMVTAMDLVQEAQSCDRRHLDVVRQRIKTADLMVVDDLGASRDTEFGREAVFSAIDMRYATKRPMLVTTNLTVEQMASGDMGWQRLYGRVLERCLPIEFTSERSAVDGGSYSEFARKIGI